MILLALLYFDQILGFFLCILQSTVDVGAVNLNGIKTLLAYGFITFFIKDNSVFSIGQRNLPRNPPDCIILDNWVFDSLISVDELFPKPLQRFATCLLVNNNSWGKLVLSLELPILFDDGLKTTSVSFFVANFNLLSYKFDSFTFKVFYWVILYC